mmetsp:Transcript_5676/g.22401  ORF Transcript_5676/g.22401 Transcript_5676/m.22401 type:complete len:118 (-) Transcript_5676:82-435(-)
MQRDAMRRVGSTAALELSRAQRAGVRSCDRPPTLTGDPIALPIQRSALCDRRYPTTQADFFERAAAPFKRRDAFFGFTALAYGLGIVAYGAVGVKQTGIPIVVGPTKPAELGPRGKK